MDLLTIIVLIVIFFSIIILSWIWPPDSPWAPAWRTSKSTARTAFKIAKVKKGEVVFELGSGEAKALMIAADEFGAKGVGIEIDPIRFYLSKITIWRKGFSNKISLKRGNFFKEDLSQADVIYVYLVTKTINRLIPKFKKELKKGTRIVSFKYKMDWPIEKEDLKNELRLYII
jgi:hypothetical protein